MRKFIAFFALLAFFSLPILAQDGSVEVNLSATLPEGLAIGIDPLDATWDVIDLPITQEEVDAWVACNNGPHTLRCTARLLATSSWHIEMDSPANLDVNAGQYDRDPSQYVRIIVTGFFSGTFVAPTPGSPYNIYENGDNQAYQEANFEFQFKNMLLTQPGDYTGSLVFTIASDII